MFLDDCHLVNPNPDLILVKNNKRTSYSYIDVRIPIFFNQYLLAIRSSMYE